MLLSMYIVWCGNKLFKRYTHYTQGMTKKNSDETLVDIESLKEEVRNLREARAVKLAEEARKQFRPEPLGPLKQSRFGRFCRKRNKPDTQQHSFPLYDLPTNENTEYNPAMVPPDPPPRTRMSLARRALHDSVETVDEGASNC